MTAEEYKKEAVEKLSKFVVGGNDQAGNLITWIYLKADEYIVYEVKSKDMSNSIRVVVEPWTKDDKDNLIDNFYKINAKYLEVKGLIYKVVNFKDIKSKIAYIIAVGIKGNTDLAIEQFDDLIKTINKDYKEQLKNRLKYLASVLTYVLLASAFAIITYAFQLFLEFNLIRSLIFTIAAGSIGGFISVSRRIRQMAFEKDVEAYQYFFYGIERSLISSFGAVIIYFVITSNLAFGIINELEKPLYGITVFSFIAGFSETLIPNLLIKLERENT